MCPQLSTVLREHSELKRLRSHVSLITCFTLSICSAAYMYKLLDEAIADFEAELPESDDFREDMNEKRSPNTVSQLRAVLDQRGVLYSSVELNDIEFAVNSTGVITSSELSNAEAEQLEFANTNFSNSPDALLYRKLVNPFHQSVNLDYASSSFKPNSIVFDSESEFIEHVEDKKDSVWLLAVASPQSLSSSIAGDHTSTTPSRIKHSSVVTEQIWSVLCYRYQSFGFKMGLLNCGKLHSLCIDRGFINPDLILALPKGGERMKDIVQFRPLPKDPKSTSIIDHESSNYILEGIHTWIVSVLAERVKPLNNINSIYSVNSILSIDRLIRMDYLKHLFSFWLLKRPQPIHVLWFPGFSVKSKISRSHQQPPLVLSALSVTYTGRVRFWIVPNEAVKQNHTAIINNFNNWPITDSSINTVHDFCIMSKYEKHNDHFTNNSHSRRNRLDPVLVRERLNQIPPDQLWDELSRLIIQSDIELRSGSADSATSSTLESDNRYPHYQTFNNQSKCANERLSSNLITTQSDHKENTEVIEGYRLLRRLRRLYHILSQQTDHLTSASMNPIASFSSADVYHQGSRENNESLNHKTAAHMYTWNCLSSLGNNNAKPHSSVNSSHCHSQTRKSFSNTKQPISNVVDTNYEAEDEYEDTSSDDRIYPKISSLTRRRYRTHLCPNIRSNHLSNPITVSPSSSSTSDTDTIDHEAYLNNSFLHSRKISKRSNLLSSNSILSTSSSSSYMSSNDINFSNPLNDWPSWVVPCKECVVCWQKFRLGVRLSALPCGHGFHEYCIRKWLDTGAFECPVCRWPAYAPHLRQQCQMIEQLISAVQNTIDYAKNSNNKN
uniref:RING-type domain-containing protein n=1 Tax=Schistosoma mansoni TaxID=6183 RepID=A0A5K4FDK4_SCHMA